MSRYLIPSKDPKHRIHVGWDNPMTTFFCQVADPTLDEDHEMIFWAGGEPEELGSVSALEEALKPYADIPQNIKEKLKTDYEARTEPTPLQKFGLRLAAKLKDQYNQ